MTRIVALFSVLALVPVARGGDPVLALEDAVALALADNHRLAAADADVDVDDARRAEARGARLPNVAFEENVSHSTDPVLVFGSKLRQEAFTQQDFALDALNRPDALSNFNTRVVVEQPLWLGGRIRRGVRAADESLQASLSQRERTRQEVVYGVIDAYTAAVVADAQLRVAGEALETARANTRLVADLREGGLVVESDLLQARVRETEVEEMVARAESARAVSRAALNLEMGRGLDEPLNLPGALERPELSDADLERLLLEARESRPDLLAARARVRAAEQAIRMARSGGLPWIGLSGSYEANAENGIGGDGTNWSLFAGLRWTAFDGRQTRSRVERANAEARKARRLGILLEQSAEVEIYRSFHELRAARKRLEQAARSIGLAEESLRIVRDRYGEGLTTLVELLDAETALTRARTRELSALRDAWLTDAALQLAAGRL